MIGRRKTKSRFGEAYCPVLKFFSVSVQRDREIISKKLIFLSSPVEVSDESLTRAKRKSGLLNSLPVLPFLSIVVCVCAKVPVWGVVG
ncbi:hypothetical protein NC653_016925 [Populus alba x Populus x berolinensis]|uniref:Uncharacterized protein n=1 Tax=Populus alba x Populus x berolinensis TaxID=444605 RepID=A0AAD6QNZ9_9ROSI|nr:hypothetical protein NC653_016925 [Populus alba x Populus x berolinensis]